MRCPACQTETTISNARFCASCGAPLPGQLATGADSSPVTGASATSAPGWPSQPEVNSAAVSTGTNPYGWPGAHLAPASTPLQSSPANPAPQASSSSAWHAPAPFANAPSSTHLTSMTKQSPKRGPVTALVCGVGSIVAFFGMPYLTVMGLVSATGGQLAGLSRGASALLWVIPIVGVTAAIAGLISLSRNEPAKNASGCLVAGGVLGGLVLLALILVLHHSLGEFSSAVSTGIGFWLTGIAMIGIVVAGYYLGTDG